MRKIALITSNLRIEDGRWWKELWIIDMASLRPNWSLRSLISKAVAFISIDGHPCHPASSQMGLPAESTLSATRSSWQLGL